MSYFTIDGFKDAFQQGARGYLFYVLPNFPTGVEGDINQNKARYLVRSSSLPTRTIEPIETQYQGYTYKFGGKSTVEDWTITYVVDGNADIYNKYLAWMDAIHDMKTNEHGNPSDYIANQDVQLLDGKGKAIKSIRLVDAWPTSVAALELAYDSADVLTFDVTFAYLYHEDGPTT